MRSTSADTSWQDGIRLCIVTEIHLSDRYSEDEGTVQTTAEPLPPAERAQRSKGADLADLLKETFADDSFTVSRYRCTL